MIGWLVIIVVALAGLVLFGVAWEHFDDRANDLDAENHHQALMRELRRHDGDRRLSDRRPR